MVLNVSTESLTAHIQLMMVYNASRHKVHASAGNLINQFLDYNANQRTDEWGGSIENRARFGLAVLKAMKESFGADVAVKVSPAGGYNDIGYVTLLWMIIPFLKICLQDAPRRHPRDLHLLYPQSRRTRTFLHHPSALLREIRLPH